jgi:predicted esterase
MELSESGKSESGNRAFHTVLFTILNIPVLVIGAIGLFIFFRERISPILGAALASVFAMDVLIQLRFFLTGSKWKKAFVVCAMALALPALFFILHRITTRADLPDGWRFCVNDRCEKRAPWYAYVLSEKETALPGLHLARWRGRMPAARAEQAARSLSREFNRYNNVYEPRRIPNASILHSTPGVVRYQLWEPTSGPEKKPCLIVLHGVGGALSLDMEILAHSQIGDEAVIISPIPDEKADWRKEAGLALLREIVEKRLPQSVDQEKIFLMGLSESAMGVTKIAFKESMGNLFRGFILVSGMGVDLKGDGANKRFLVLYGDGDDGLPNDYMLSGMHEMRRQKASAHLMKFDGNHMLFLDRKHEVTGAILEFMMD